MDRVMFLDSVSGINYPLMLVNFFDQFIALKELVENTGSRITVCNSTPKSITFSIQFNSANDQSKALQQIQTGMVINIYDRPIRVYVDILTDTEIKIKLQ